MAELLPTDERSSDEHVVQAMDAAIEWINIYGSNTSDPKTHADLIEKLKECVAIRDEALAALKRSSPDAS